ncbi:MAG: protein-L-isoaspartate(D-aspartate) O-methyltransferase [Anaerolineales bacterium]
MIAEDEYTLKRKLMVEEQIAGRGIRDARVLAALGRVPRHCFIPPENLAWAYADGPLPIGYGQTISQPYIVALMSELLEVEPGERVLEVGSGCGYQAAVLGELAAEVHTVEVIPELACQAEKNLTDLGYTSIHVHTCDGSLGWPGAAPYRRILVAAAAPEVPPALPDQLAEGGQLVIPVGDRSVQNLEVWKRAGRRFDHWVSLEVRFVPLRGLYGWK